MVKGVAPNAPIITNEKGGKQSESKYAFHMIADEAILALAERLAYGANRYARDNWRKIPAEEHWNHCCVHWYAWKAEDKTDDHLAAFFCRAMMAFACAKEESSK